MTMTNTRRDCHGGEAREGKEAAAVLSTNLRMDFGGAERLDALEIKDAVEDDPELEPLNDFWCATLACVDHGHAEASIHRVQALQALTSSTTLTKRCNTLPS